MTRILVVDDNAVDRTLISRLLEPVAGSKPDTACDGVEALEKIRTGDYELVVTDLQMPRVNGVELVREVRKSFPNLPVLLVTAFGSEPEAVAALRAGAANFSHKSRLRQDLSTTARAIIDWSSRIRLASQEPVVREQENKLTFVLDNDPSEIPRLIEACVEHLPDWARVDELRIGLSLCEALTNAICHGNLEVSSVFKASAEDCAYEKRVHGKRDCEPWCQRRVHVQASFSDDQIKFRIHDQGAGFDPASLSDPRDPENILKTGGRGLLLIRTYMDEVVHNVTGNEITMIKRRQPGV